MTFKSFYYKKFHIFSFLFFFLFSFLFSCTLLANEEKIQYKLYDDSIDLPKKTEERYRALFETLSTLNAFQFLDEQSMGVKADKNSLKLYTDLLPKTLEKKIKAYEENFRKSLAKKYQPIFDKLGIEMLFLAIYLEENNLTFINGRIFDFNRAETIKKLLKMKPEDYPKYIRSLEKKDPHFSKVLKRFPELYQNLETHYKTFFDYQLSLRSLSYFRSSLNKKSSPKDSSFKTMNNLYYLSAPFQNIEITQKYNPKTIQDLIKKRFLFINSPYIKKTHYSIKKIPSKKIQLLFFKAEIFSYYENSKEVYHIIKNFLFLEHLGLDLSFWVNLYNERYKTKHKTIWDCLNLPENTSFAKTAPQNLKLRKVIKAYEDLKTAFGYHLLTYSPHIKERHKRYPDTRPASRVEPISFLLSTYNLTYLADCVQIERKDYNAQTLKPLNPSKKHFYHCININDPDFNSLSRKASEQEKLIKKYQDFLKIYRKAYQQPKTLKNVISSKRKVKISVKSLEKYFKLLFDQKYYSTSGIDSIFWED